MGLRHEGKPRPLVGHGNDAHKEQKQTGEPKPLGNVSQLLCEAGQQNQQDARVQQMLGSQRIVAHNILSVVPNRRDVRGRHPGRG